MSGPREKALSHIACSTFAAFCKRVLQNARHATRFGETRKSPYSTRLFEDTRGEASRGEGGLVFGSFPYARAPALWVRSWRGQSEAPPPRLARPKHRGFRDPSRNALSAAR
jgi:hypothetical protein